MRMLHRARPAKLLHLPADSVRLPSCPSTSRTFHAPAPPGPPISRRKSPEQGGCGVRGCSLWKLACARRHTSPTSAYIASHLNKVAAGMQLVEAGLQAIQHPASPARPHRKSPEQGGQRGCSLWKLACARSAYQNSLSILSCIPAMHLPPPRSALAREPHATAPVPGPHDARDAARAAHAHTTRVSTLILK